MPRAWAATNKGPSGLCCPLATAGQPESPLGAGYAAAQARGYDAAAASAAGVTGQQPFNGYYFRILNAQGASAKGGAYSYMVKDKMVGGFALIAYPVQYGVSGVMTFLVNHDGTVFQKNLGPSTAMIAEGTKTFNPDKTWTVAGNTNTTLATR